MNKSKTSLEVSNGLLSAGERLAELRKIQPQFERLWQLITSQLTFEDGWQSGEDVFHPNKKITSSIKGDMREIDKTLKSISVADAKIELSRYGVTRFNEMPELHGWHVDYEKLTDDTSVSLDDLGYVYDPLLAYRYYYNPSRVLTDEERQSISQGLLLGKYLNLLYDKVRYLHESQRVLETVKEQAFYLLDDREVQEFVSRGGIAAVSNGGIEFRYNSREDTKEVRNGWRGEEELVHARMLNIEIAQAIDAIYIAHNHAIDAFPGVSKDNLEYQKLQLQTQVLLADLAKAVSDLQGPIGDITERLSQ